VMMVHVCHVSSPVKDFAKAACQIDVAHEQTRNQRNHGMIEIHILSNIIICVASRFAGMISRCDWLSSVACAAWWPRKLYA
jgi:hypothetical protein